MTTVRGSGIIHLHLTLFAGFVWLTVRSSGCLSPNTTLIIWVQWQFYSKCAINIHNRTFRSISKKFLVWNKRRVTEYVYGETLVPLVRREWGQECAKLCNSFRKGRQEEMSGRNGAGRHIRYMLKLHTWLSKQKWRREFCKRREFLNIL